MATINVKESAQTNLHNFLCHIHLALHFYIANSFANVIAVVPSKLNYYVFHTCVPHAFHVSYRNKKIETAKMRQIHFQQICSTLNITHTHMHAHCPPNSFALDYEISTPTLVTANKYFIQTNHAINWCISVFATEIYGNVLESLVSSHFCAWVVWSLNKTFENVFLLFTSGYVVQQPQHTHARLCNAHSAHPKLSSGVWHAMARFSVGSLCIGFAHVFLSKVS